MRTLAEAVFLLLRGFAPYSAEPDPETDVERAARLLTPTIAIVSVAAGRADALELAAALAYLGKTESNFARYVGLGHCDRGPPGARCDPRAGVATSRTYWQLKRATCPAAWEFEPGSIPEAVAAARCAARVYSAGLRRCRRARPDAPEAGAFAAYLGGAWGCHWPGADRSVAGYRQTLSRLRLLSKR